MAEGRPYVASCAGCDERRAFATVAELAEWSGGHDCWTPRPENCEACQQPVVVITSWDEVPSFASEREEQDWWCRHRPSPQLVDAMGPQR